MAKIVLEIDGSGSWCWSCNALRKEVRVEINKLEKKSKGFETDYFCGCFNRTLEKVIPPEDRQPTISLSGCGGESINKGLLRCTECHSAERDMEKLREEW